MKVILEFQLPEEQSEYDSAINGAKTECAISEFGNFLRSEYKYNNTLSDQERAYLEKVHERWFDVLKEYGVTP